MSTLFEMLSSVVNCHHYFLLLLGDSCWKEISRRHNLRRGKGESRGDIYDGIVYQNLVHSGFLSNEHNISLIFNTDGVPVFRSSSFSMWPILLLVNELPYRMRCVGHAHIYIYVIYNDYIFII